MLDASQGYRSKGGLFIPSPARIKERERILQARYFFVRAAGGPAGEVFRCRECKGKHPYLTLRCIEQPFSGITGGLFGYFDTFKDADAFDMLSPEQQTRVARIGRELTFSARNAAAFARAHPQTARAMVEDDRDGVRAALALGVLVPVSATMAQRYLDKINGRGGRTQPPYGPLIVPGLRS
jgi:hypothetical protein